VIRLPVVVAEKGSHWCTLRVSGTPGHASQPFRTDNALVTAAEVVRRLAGYHPQTDIHDTWRRYVEGMGFSAERSQALLDPDGLEDYCATLPIGLGRNAHACTHTTIAPTMVQGGVKTNVIPDRVDLQVSLQPVSPADLLEDTGTAETSATVAARVRAARGVAAARLSGTGWRINADVPGPQLRSRWRLPAAVTSRADLQLDRGTLSARGYDRVLRVAWSVSDLAGRDRPARGDVDEAVALRSRWSTQ